MRLLSLVSMLIQCEGPLETDDLTDWEERFVAGLIERYGHDTTKLSGNQAGCIERIWRKHFA